MDRHLFDDAIGSPPPSTVDVEAVIARQRRGAFVRRVVGPGSAAVAAVVAVTFGAALAVPGGLTGGSGGGRTPGSEPAATPPASSWGPSGPSEPATSSAPNTTDTCGPPTDLPAIPGEPADIAARLHDALDAAVRGQLPGAQLTANPVARYEDRQYGPLEFAHIHQDGGLSEGGACGVPEDYYLARATVTDAAGAGNILTYLGAAGDGTSNPATCPTAGVTAPEVTACEQHTGPAGEQITALTLRLEQGSTTNRVDVLKPDGTMVTLLSENVAVDGKEGGPPQRPTPPLTHDQLITIALLPTLTLFP